MLLIIIHIFLDQDRVKKKTDFRDVILDSSDLQQSGPSSNCAGVVVSHEILTVKLLLLVK